MDKKILQERLKKLNWTPYRLAKEVCALKAEGGKIPPVTQYQSAVSRAVSEPKKSKLETIEELIKALGGTLIIKWNDEPEAAEIKLHNNIAVVLQEQAQKNKTTIEELVNLLLQQSLFDLKKEEAYIPATSLKGLLRSLIPDLIQEAENSTIGMQLNELTKSIQQINLYLNKSNESQVSTSNESKAELISYTNNLSSNQFSKPSSFTRNEFSLPENVEHLEKSLSKDTNEHPYVQELIPNNKDYKKNVDRNLVSESYSKYNINNVNSELESIQNIQEISIKKDAQDLFKKGIKYLEQRNYQGAVDNFSEAISIDPEFAQAYGNTGLIYLIYLNEYDKAIDYFT
ncbi:MAG: RAMP superfamily CRISPR-associated protein, partial [Cyanobacteria bacterium J06649_11]